MRSVFRQRLIAVAVAGIPAIGLSPLARAQLEEIIVTAQKRPEAVQDIPLAVTVLSGATLDRLGITDVGSLAKSVPGMQVSQDGPDARITLRGIGAEQVTPTGDPGVAFHIDGVYQARTSAASELFYDLERVEVLRGPQGTLYGRNATGGSINLVSNRPVEDFGADAEVQVGDYSQRRYRGVLNTPVVADTLLFRLSGQYETRDGYYENLTPGADDLEDRESHNLQGQLLWNASEDLSAILRANHGSNEGAGEGYKVVGDYPVPPADNRLINRFYALRGASPNPDDPWQVRTNGIEERDNERQGASLTLDWAFDTVTLKSISAWQENVSSFVQDIDRSDADILDAYNEDDSKQLSQELQLASSGDCDLSWVTGLYWLEEETDTVFWLFDQGAGLGILPFFPKIDVGLAYPAYFGNETTVESESFGAFGQATYRVADDVQITAGARYSKDEKQADILRKEFTSGLTRFGKDGDWDKPTWKLGADWFVTPDSMLYASVSTGFKSGGFLQETGAEPYEPEEVLAWEAGSKNQFLDNRLQANLSAFWYDYTDMQLRTLRGLQSVVTNAGESEIKGLEVELLAEPVDALALSAALAWTDATFTDYVDDDPADALPNTPLDLSGNDLARSPDYTANLMAEYTWDTPLGALTATVSYYWSDEVFFSAYNRPEGDSEDSYHRTDAGLRLDSKDDTWYLAAGVQNIEDDEVATQATVPTTSLGGAKVAQWQPPRIWNVAIGYRFQ